MNDPQRTRRRVVAVPARRPPAELRALRVVVKEDLDPDVSYLEQEEFEERLAEYRRGEFGFVVVRAEAEVIIGGTDQILTSPGLAGIENDAPPEEIEQIAAEEWAALRDVLKAVGVSTEQLPLELDREWIEWRT
jgi:hypothetical protein